MNTTMKTIATAVVAAAALSFGCAGADGTVIPGTLNTNADDVIPTMEDVGARIALEGDQATDLASAISTWRDDAGSRSRAGRSFLMDAADILEPAQLSELITMLHERRAAFGEARGTRGMNGGGPRGAGDGTCDQSGPRGPRGPRGEGTGAGDRPFGDRGPGMGQGSGLRAALADLATEVDITDEMQQSLRDAGRAAHEPVADAMTAFHDGTGSIEDVRGATATAQATMEAAFVDILGAESAARLDELLTAQRAEQAQKKLDTLGDRTDDRVEFLTRVLSLTENQISSLRSIVEVAEETQFLTEVIAGEHGPGDMLVHRLTARAEVEAATRAILDETQIGIFDQLEDMRPHRPRGPRADGPRGRGARPGGGRGQI